MQERLEGKENRVIEDENGWIDEMDVSNSMDISFEITLRDGEGQGNSSVLQFMGLPKDWTGLNDDLTTITTYLFDLHTS